MLSTELRLALSPSRTYRQLVAEHRPASWRATIGPLAFSLLMIGAFAAILATRRVTPGLVFIVAVSWSFALVIQALAGSMLILSAPGRPVGGLRAFELLFAGHAPWSLWMLALAACAMTWNPSIGVERAIATAVVPVAWTAVMLSGFCQEVLGTSKAGARLRTTLHQLGVWTVILVYIVWAAGGLMNVIGAVIE